MCTIDKRRPMKSLTISTNCEYSLSNDHLDPRLRILESWQVSMKHLHWSHLFLSYLSVTLTTEIGLNIHFIEGIKSVNFGNFKSKGKIYTDVQEYIEDNTFFTEIKVDYFYYILFAMFLFPTSLVLLLLLSNLVRPGARAFPFLPRHKRRSLFI